MCFVYFGGRTRVYMQCIITSTSPKKDTDTVKSAAKTRDQAPHRTHRQDDGLSPELCRKVLRDCGSFNLRKASRAVTQLYDDILQPTGLRSTQVVVLVALAAAPEVSLARLARELVLSPSTLSRTIRPLERDGLLKVQDGGGRGKSVQLTPRGEKVLLAAVPYWRKAQEEFTAMVGASAWQQLARQLTKTTTAVRR